MTKISKLKEMTRLQYKKSNDIVKTLHDVQYVPSLEHNLLSVGQLMVNEYFILFDEMKVWSSQHQRLTIARANMYGSKI